MPAHRLSMRKTREILRLRWGLGLAGRRVAESLHCSPSTVYEVEGRAELAKLTWPLPEEIDDAAREALAVPQSEDAQGPGRAGLRRNLP